jgi:hypothetical protein
VILDAGFVSWAFLLIRRARLCAALPYLLVTPWSWSESTGFCAKRRGQTMKLTRMVGALALLAAFSSAAGISAQTQAAQALATNPTISVANVTWNGTGWNVAVVGHNYTPGGQAWVGAAVSLNGNWQWQWGAQPTASPNIAWKYPSNAQPLPGDLGGDVYATIVIPQAAAPTGVPGCVLPQLAIASSDYTTGRYPPTLAYFAGGVPKPDCVQDLYVSLATGNDDKRWDSIVALQINGFRVEYLSTFGDTLDSLNPKYVHFSVPAMTITAASRIQVEWSGGAGDKLCCNQPDSWDLSSLQIWTGNGVGYTLLISYGPHHFGPGGYSLLSVQASARPPHIISFGPTQPRVTYPQKATLTWDVWDCGSDCTVQINDYADNRIAVFTGKASGQVLVQPYSDPTTFKLIVQNGDGDDRAATSVHVNPAGTTSNGPCGSNCQVYYFKINNPSSYAQPCTHDALGDVPNNLPHATQDEEHTWGGIATPESYGDWVNSVCP